MKILKVCDHLQNEIVGQAAAKFGFATVKFERFKLERLFDQALLEFDDEFVVPRKERNLTGRVIDLAEVSQLPNSYFALERFFATKSQFTRVQNAETKSGLRFL